MASDRPRQAVVIIHSIGEQIAMQTLRSFVDAVTFGVARNVAFRCRALSKPDYISPTLELHRMAVPGHAKEWVPGTGIAAGVVALLKQARPDLTQEECKRLLRETARRIKIPAAQDGAGAGIIDARRALRAL